MSETSESPRTHQRHKGKLSVIPSTPGEFPSIIYTDADGIPFSHTVCCLLTSTSDFKTDQEKEEKNNEYWANAKKINSSNHKFVKKKH